jgi:aldehyde:ferredoxin oxidoreductase
MTASRQGFGELMARGAAGAAAELGTAQLELARIHDPYEPRYCNVNTFLFPFEPRKPIQQLHEAGLVLSQWSSWLQGVEGAHISSEVFRGIAERFWGGAEAADLTTLRGKPLAARKIQDRQYAKESLVVCDWMYPVIDNPQGEDHVGDPTFESRILAAVTGEPWDEASLARAGERVFNLQRAILLREGHRAAEDDLLPPEWHEKPLEGHIADVECNVPGPDGQPVSRVGERVEMEAYLEARREYYRLRGWDPATGLQSPALLRELQLPEAAEALAGLGLLAEPDRLS